MARRSTLLFIAATSLVLLGYNSLVYLVPVYAILYIPLNLAMAGAIFAASRRFGLSGVELGLERSAIRSGLKWGGVVTAVVAGGLGVAVAVPGLHPLLDDARVAGIGLGLLAYRALLRIPLGTVVLEELAFRGVIFGAWARLSGAVHAAIGSSVVFGLWHIRPAIELLDVNDLAGSVGPRIAAVTAAVILTAGAGLFFCFLRIRNRSLLAPVLAHATINSLATVAAFVVRSS